MSLYLPTDYRPTLAPDEMEAAIYMLKHEFQRRLADKLNLRRVTAPLFVAAGTGINDDLNGTERPVSFPIKDLGGLKAEVVHSLAKWKRMKLGSAHIPAGAGIYTDMNAIRADEELDNLHSLYVDQWDWERTITREDRTIGFLKQIVGDIYDVIRQMEREVERQYPHIKAILPEKITFIHSEDLLAEYPDLTPAEREKKAAEKYGAIFVIGIGSQLADGKKHDGRAPDYDDWTTPTSDRHKGLNGDIIVWHPVLKRAFELSSMGIRVDKEALLRQLELEGCTQRTTLSFHQALLNDRIPLSIGGGIGQSRLCMYLLRCAHIGEVQASIWGDEMVSTCREHNIFLN